MGNLKLCVRALRTHCLQATLDNRYVQHQGGLLDFDQCLTMSLARYVFLSSCESKTIKINNLFTQESL